VLETGGMIVSRFDQLRTQRGTFETTWQDISDNILGLRDFNTVRTPGEQRMRRIYDTTGLVAGTRLVAALHGSMLNPAAKWFFLKVEPEEMAHDPDIFEWLEFATKSLRHVFRKAEFGFTNATAEWLLDQVFFGTGDFFVDDIPGHGPRFHSRPLGEMYVDESWQGRPDTFYRWYMMSARRVVQQFGDVDSEVTRWAEKEPDRDVRMLHLIHPRSETNVRERDTKPWRSVYVLHGQKKIISRGGYWTQPHMMSRWSKENSELYGRSPAWTALSSCKMANEMEKTMLKTAQKAADPPLLVPDDGVLSMISTSPGSLNVYRAHVFKDDPIRPFPVAQQPVLGERAIEGTRAQIKEAFFADMIALPDTRAMPATQVIELEDKMARSMVSQIGRLTSEGIDPMLFRTLDVLERGGFIPRRPPQMRDVEVSIEYMGPAHRAQKQAEGRAIMGAWAAVGQLSQLVPEAQDNLDPDESTRLLVESQGVPPGILRPIGERDALRQERAQAQQAQEQLDQADQLSQIAGQAGQAINSDAQAQATRAGIQ